MKELYSKNLLIHLIFLIAFTGCSSNKQTNLANFFSKEDTDLILFFSDRKIPIKKELHTPIDLWYFNAQSPENVNYLSFPGVPRLPTVSWNKTKDTFLISSIQLGLGPCITIYSFSGGECVLDVKDVNFGHSATYSPLEHKFVFITSQKSLAIFNLMTQSIEVIESEEELDNPQYPQWSPDGNYIVYENNKEIWLYTFANKSHKKLIDHGSQPFWNPNSQSFIFVDKSDLWLYNFQEKQTILLLDDPLEASYPSWSPDGKYILFTSNRDGNLEIYMANADGTNQVNLTNHPADDYAAFWRP